MTRWRAAGLVLAMGMVAGAGACGSGDGAAGDGEVAVVAAFYPLAEVAIRVGGDHVAVTNLTAPGVEPHDAELSPRQVDAIEDADVLLYIGAGFQPAVEDLASRVDGVAVDLLDGEAEDGTDVDPHVWLDPQRMQGIVAHVRDVFVEADPGGAADYRDNAAAYAAELTRLDGDLASGLEQCERRVIVTAHAAFGYLALRYDLTQRAISGLSPESEPDPDRLAELADDVEAEGITTIFYESLVPPDLAETLAREADVATAVLNPIEGLTDDEEADGATYETLMRENLAALRGALDCR